ncbi:MAG TPA: efflux RND transporter periplasmic adaptor subunit [Gammaproteobacteria bacterium]|nr:efflux RND transporter periplasmic adaptor subunit [Gammaproteobacteria bacterium]
MNALSDRTDNQVRGIRDTSGQDRPIDLAPQRRRRRWIALGVLVLLAVGLALAYPALMRWLSAEQSVPREQLRFSVVKRGTFVRDVSMDGRAVAAVQPMLYSSAQGTVTYSAEPGDVVRKGQVLAVVDSPELDSELKQQQAKYQSLKTALARQKVSIHNQQLENRQRVNLTAVKLQAAEREVKRYKAVVDEGIVSRREYAQARDAAAIARLEHKQALAQTKLQKQGLDFELKTKQLELQREELALADLQRRADRLTVRSPVDGIVGAREVGQNAVVTQNQPLIRVIDLSAFEIEAQIPESYADNLRNGMGAQITIGSQTYPAKVVSVAPEVKDGQVTARIRFAGEPPADLKQNQQVSVRVVLESIDNALMVQRGPFIDSGGGHVAYVAHDGVLTRKPIETGAISVNRVQILSGLQPGDRIVISDTSDFNSAHTVLISD